MKQNLNWCYEITNTYTTTFQLHSVLPFTSHIAFYMDDKLSLTEPKIGISGTR